MNERNRANILLVGMLAALVVAGCAQRDDTTSPTIQAHPVEWNDPTSEDFHGTYVVDLANATAVSDDVEARTGTEGCQSCHGENLGRGGDDAADDQCYVCHGSGSGIEPGHPARSRFVSPAGDAFHGDAVIAAEGVDGCLECHGVAFDEDGDDTIDQVFSGGWSGVSCNGCHPGPSGHPAPEVWIAPADDDYHGNVIQEAESTEDCAACHGVDYAGGWTEVSCTECHAGGRSGHPADAEFVALDVFLDDPGSEAAEAARNDPNFHVNVLGRRGIGECFSCHGSGGSGGWAEVSCAECHSLLSGTVTFVPSGGDTR